MTHVEAAHISGRLEYLRGELRAERISQGELLELQSLSQHIAPDDVELLEAAGVPEQVNTETKFTPGPWQVEKANHRMRVVFRQGDPGQPGWKYKHITPDWREQKSGAKRGCSPSWYGFGPLDEANAALIAAAPEMFEALQSALSHIEQHDQTHSTRTAYDRVMNAGRAALSKAKGGAK